LKQIPLHPRPAGSGRVDQILLEVRKCFGTELSSASGLVFDEERKTLLIERENAPKVLLSLTIVSEDQESVA
jgi:hypothetical protein